MSGESDLVLPHGSEPPKQPPACAICKKVFEHQDVVVQLVGQVQPGAMSLAWVHLACTLSAIVEKSRPPDEPVVGKN